MRIIVTAFADLSIKKIKSKMMIFISDPKKMMYYLKNMEAKP